MDKKGVVPLAVLTPIMWAFALIVIGYLILGVGVWYTLRNHPTILVSIIAFVVSLLIIKFVRRR